MQKCVVDECQRDVHVKKDQLCGPHYKRRWRTGDVQAGTPLSQPRARPVPVVDHEDGTRECQACDRRLPLSDFHADARAPKGRRKTCKTCRVQVEIARYWEDPVATRERMRQYRADNLEQIRLRDMERYERDKTKRIAAATETAHRRRARMFGRDHVRGITVPAVRRLDGDQCCYCGTTMVFGRFPRGERPDDMATLEHITPISRGGTHTWDNVALSCWRDNITKGAATEGWQVRDGHRLSQEPAWSALARA